MLCSPSQYLFVILDEPVRRFRWKQFPVAFSDNLFHRFADGSCASCVDEPISAFCILHKDRVSGGVGHSAPQTLLFFQRSPRRLAVKFPAQPPRHEPQKNLICLGGTKGGRVGSPRENASRGR